MFLPFSSFVLRVLRFDSEQYFAHWISVHLIYGEPRDLFVYYCQSSCGSADYFDNVMTKFNINDRTDALKTDINLIKNCRIAGSRSLTRRMNFKFMCLSAY